MGKWKALLVDDEEEFVSSLAARLQLRGIRVLTATDAREALALVESEQPQVVVLDIVMPGISGMQALQHIKVNHPEIEVILLSGRGTTRDGIEGMRLGAFDFMMKPVDIGELIARMLEALGMEQAPP